ncbi:MAG: EscU/YscU/HrcU family type III secretion system export apparatus switch protein [Bryobacteraceae bacterium]
MSEKSQKTEQPTQRRLLKSREEGQFLSSKEFVAGTQFLAFVFVLVTYSNEWFFTLRQIMRYSLKAAFRGELTPLTVTNHLRDLVLPNLSMIFLGAGVLLGASLAAQVATTRLGFAFNKLVPDFSRLDPSSRIKNMPSQNIPAAMQALILLPIFLFTVYLVVNARLAEFLSLPLGNTEAGAMRVAAALESLLWRAAFAFFLFGCIDLLRQKRKHSSELKMTKQEIRDEHKEVEGNPQIKMKIRKLQRDALRRNMMKQVPLATAVIVNPTHYAVAIKYQVDSMAAPTVVAKGRNYLALRIRQKAMDHQVPIVENVALAQALYKSVEVGQEIPAHLYRAVAEILAYIFKLMNGHLPGQG